MLRFCVIILDLDEQNQGKFQGENLVISFLKKMPDLICEYFLMAESIIRQIDIFQFNVHI